MHPPRVLRGPAADLPARRAAFAGLVAALLLAVGACGAGGTEPRAKNVLLLVADTLRADRLGCYGYSRPTSPAIDALAARGTLYENAYAQACWTVPSMISMMTGVSVTVEETTVPRLPVLAEVLRKHGFETAAFPANMTLYAQRGFERGFEVFDETVGNVDAVALAGRFEEWYRGRGPGPGGDDPRPFFAWVQFIDPHEPYEPGPEHDVFDGPLPNQAELSARWEALLPRVAELSSERPPKPFEEAAARMVELANRYDGEVRAVDDGVDRILALLRETGELEDTLVILCSDHGEMLFEHPIPQPFLVQDTLERHAGLPEGVADLLCNGHRPWYFEELWRTPLILAGPGVPAGRRVGGLAANLDLYPTILDALDLPAPGHSLEGASLIGGSEPPRERVFAHGHLTSAVRERSGKKLIRHPPRLFLLDEGAPPPLELYDLSRDPRELRERAADDPAEAKRLGDELERWHEKNRREAETHTTPEWDRHLKALGYIDEESPAPAGAEGAPPPR